MGFRWIAAPMERRSLNPLRELALLYWLWLFLRHEQADVVHGFTIKCAVYGALVGRLAGISRVSAVAGLGYVFTSPAVKARILRPIVRILMTLALGGQRGRVILQNPDDVQFFKDAHIVPSEQIVLIQGSGVDCLRFQPGPERVWMTDVPLRVVLVGRMLWDKGLAEFVEAAGLLQADGRALKFILVGDPDLGNPASVPEQIMRRWQAEGGIEWIGHVSDMPGLLRGADIVVLPSYREGLPKSLIEAAACGKPLITTDVPGCREVVTDGVDGLLVPVRDGRALAAAIARMHDDPALARRLGAAARQKALAMFDERIVIGRTLKVYADVLA